MEVSGFSSIQSLPLLYISVLQILYMVRLQDFLSNSNSRMAGLGSFGLHSFALAKLQGNHSSANLSIMAFFLNDQEICHTDPNYRAFAWRSSEVLMGPRQSLFGKRKDERKDQCLLLMATKRSQQARHQRPPNKV